MFTSSGLVCLFINDNKTLPISCAMGLEAVGSRVAEGGARWRASFPRATQCSTRRMPAAREPIFLFALRLKNRQWQLSVVRTSPRLASAAAAAARTRRRRSLARRLATRLAADVRCARPTVRSVACAALRAALRALLRLHCLSLLLLVVVMVLLLVEMLLLARRGSATGLDERVASI